MPVTLDEFTADVIGLVSRRAEDALFEVGGVRTVEEHVLVVVGLDDKVVGRADIRLHLFVDGAAVGHEHETLTLEVDAVPEAVGGVMLDMEGVDLHTKQFPLHSFLEIASAGTQLLAHAVVAVDTLVDESRRVDRQVNAFAECAYRADMIGMIVRDEHTHDILKIEPHVAQTLLYLARRDARVNEDTPLTRAEVVAVAAATAGKAPEYEFVFFHNTYLRVLLLPPLVVRVELEPLVVRVELEPPAVRVLFVDSRLTVVVRPVSSVDLMTVRVVPDLFTRLSTVVEGEAVRVVVVAVEVRGVTVPEVVRVVVVVDGWRVVVVVSGFAVEVLVEVAVSGLEA